MMKNICVLFLLFICAGAHAQNKRGFVGVDAFFDIPFEFTEPGFGGSLSGNIQLGKDRIYAGAGVGVVKIPDAEGVAVPVSFRFMAIAGQKRTAPMILFSPGFLIYNKSVAGVEVNGGFTLFAGGGLAFGSGATLSLGYSLYSFNTGYNSDFFNSKTEALQLRFGAMIK